MKVTRSHAHTKSNRHKQLRSPRSLSMKARSPCESCELSVWSWLFIVVGCWRAQRSRNHAEGVAHAAEHRAQGVGAARGAGRVEGGRGKEATLAKVEVEVTRV